MRFFTILLLLSSLLLSYQKGESLSQNIQDKLGIKKEKVYIIDFFASWCVSCKKELPYLSKINRELDKEKFEIIGIDVDEDIKKGQSFQKELSLNFKVIDDPKHEIIKEFNPVGMPAIFFIKNGKISSSIIGTKDDVEKTILDNLKEI
jgi:thiol-disulfide isomerase/thioredoxin